ncbi:MAG: glycerol-3-phosphate 1-O-acyltransferase PlsY [Chloroflexi bacterium]|nr:glycerol-3-phosphate 1-O-acyltransferase PlsY [Chloroflexota bacterium]
MDVTLAVLVGAAVGYAFGMFPTGMVIGRLHGIDPTTIGSGRIGATNIRRALGTRWALVVAAGDLLKGALAVILAGALTDSTWAQIVAASFAVLGHTFSPLIGFKGGRGVVTGAGGLLIINPIAFVVALVCGLATVVGTRYVSLGSIVGAILAGTVVIVQTYLTGAAPAYLLYGTVLPAFIIWAHRDNIQRLLSGTERRV